MTVGRRKLPGTDLEVSVIGLSAPAAPRMALPSWTASVTRAAEAGVTLFDLGAVSLDLEPLFAQVVREHTSSSLLIVSRSAERLSSVGGPTLGPSETSTVDALVERLSNSLAPYTERRPSRLLVEWSLDPSEPELDPKVALALTRMKEGKTIEAWGMRTTALTPEGVAVAPAPDFVTSSVSLLARPTAARAPKGVRPALLARDPLSHGRLDGSRFDSVGSPLSFGHAPATVLSLEDEFAPVLRLAPLVLTGRRTLAQAALRYVTDIVGAVSALVPPPDPRRWKEITEFELSPGLTAEEEERIHQLPQSLEPRSGTAPFSSRSA